MARRNKTTDTSNCELDSLARFLLPAIRAYMADEENQRAFEKWQAERNSKPNRG